MHTELPDNSRESSERARLESLLRIGQCQAKSTQELVDFALNEAMTLTGSQFGYIYFYDEESEEFTLNSWSKEVMAACSVANPQRRYRLEQTGLWGEVIRQRKPIVVNDYRADNPWKRGVPTGHAPLERFLSVPVIFEGRIKAVVGVANKSLPYHDLDILQLQLLMGTAWHWVERQREHEKLTLALREAEASNVAKTEFLANLSHELRTPMNGIVGALELLAVTQSPADAAHELTILRSCADQMCSLVGDLLDFSRLSVGTLALKKGKVDLRDIFEKIFSDFLRLSEKKGIDFASSIDPALPLQVEADAQRIRQVVDNLLDNAFKFTEPGGKVTLEVALISKNETHPMEHVEFSVRDTGIGIPSHLHEKVFERFFQVDMSTQKKFRGLGLGLAICRQLAELMEGTLTLESTLGQGSVFRLRIPLTPPAGFSP